MNRWNRLPLRTQLTAVFSVLLLVGLGLTGLVAHALLERSLIGQVDAQLESAGTALANQALRRDLSSSGQGDSVLPSDYQVVVLDTTGTVVQRYAAVQAESSPQITDLSPQDVEDYWEDVQTADRSWVSSQGRWRRVRSRLSPRSLRASRRSAKRSGGRSSTPMATHRSGWRPWSRRRDGSS